jgi:hypothetical protein
MKLAIGGADFRREMATGGELSRPRGVNIARCSRGRLNSIPLPANYTPIH